MGFWDSLVQTFVGDKKPKDLPNASAAIYPVYEVQTPQYQYPNPYNLAINGYKANEIVYACISKRAKAISEAGLMVYDTTGETKERDEQHALAQLIRKPNERVTEEEFWQISEIYLLIAGFSAWEKEYNRLGEVINLWPMRPDWCSFYRGQGSPLRAIRYQPYGLPPVDIPAEKVLIFQYFDPIFPLLKGFSPVMAAYKSIGVDNNATDFLNQFFRDGAQVSGLLKTTQSIGDVEGERIRRRWTQQHGGVGNWGQPAVLGSGIEYQQMGLNFRDMQFGDLDARSESRICSVMEVPPILVGAKVGLDRSTFSNFSEARKAFYEETVTPEWRFMASQVREQLLPDFEDDTESWSVAFDIAQVKALQEDRTASWARAVSAATAGLVTRDEARAEMGLDPIDEVDVFVGNAPAPGEETVQAETPEQLKPFTGEAQSPETETETGDESEAVELEEDKAEAEPTEDEVAEEKRFKAFAEKRVREGKSSEIEAFRFDYLDATRQAELLAEVGAVSNLPPFLGQDTTKAFNQRKAQRELEKQMTLYFRGLRKRLGKKVRHVPASV